MSELGAARYVATHRLSAHPAQSSNPAYFRILSNERSIDGPHQCSGSIPCARRRPRRVQLFKCPAGEVALTDANFHNSSFTDVNLAAASFTNVNFSNATMLDSNLSGMRIDGILV